MKTFIWHSEHYLFISVAEDEYTAKILIENEQSTLKETDSYTYYYYRPDYERAMKEEPIVMENTTAIILHHINE